VLFVRWQDDTVVQLITTAHTVEQAVKEKIESNRSAREEEAFRAPHAANDCGSHLNRSDIEDIIEREHLPWPQTYVDYNNKMRDNPELKALLHPSLKASNTGDVFGCFL